MLAKSVSFFQHQARCLDSLLPKKTSGRKKCTNLSKVTIGPKLSQKGCQKADIFLHQ